MPSPMNVFIGEIVELCDTPKACENIEHIHFNPTLVGTHESLND